MPKIDNHTAYNTEDSYIGIVESKDFLLIPCQTEAFAHQKHFPNMELPVAVSAALLRIRIEYEEKESGKKKIGFFAALCPLSKYASLAIAQEGDLVEIERSGRAAILRNGALNPENISLIELDKEDS